jgi:hypothetical protein
VGSLEKRLDAAQKELTEQLIDEAIVEVMVEVEIQHILRVLKAELEPDHFEKVVRIMVEGGYIEEAPHCPA